MGTVCCSGCLFGGMWGCLPRWVSAWGISARGCSAQVGVYPGGVYPGGVCQGVVCPVSARLVSAQCLPGGCLPRGCPSCFQNHYLFTTSFVDSKYSWISQNLLVFLQDVTNPKKICVLPTAYSVVSTCRGPDDLPGRSY